MSTVTIEEAQSRLSELIEQTVPGEEVMITRDDKIVARLIAVRPKTEQGPRLGTLKGTVLYMAPDFNDTSEEFKEYM